MEIGGIGISSSRLDHLGHLNGRLYVAHRRRDIAAIITNAARTAAVQIAGNLHPVIDLNELHATPAGLIADAATGTCHRAAQRTADTHADIDSAKDRGLLLLLPPAAPMALPT